MSDGFPQRDSVLWVFVYPINISPFRPFRLYSVSILCLYPGYHAAGYHAPSIPHGLSRLYHHCTATTPVYIFPGYHAIVYFYSWVITPKLPRSTTHVHRVITPAIVRILNFTFHRLLRHLFFSIYTTPGAPHVPTYSTPTTCSSLTASGPSIPSQLVRFMAYLRVNMID